MDERLGALDAGFAAHMAIFALAALAGLIAAAISLAIFVSVVLGGITLAESVFSGGLPGTFGERWPFGHART